MYVSYIGWTNKQNIGDDALELAFRQLCLRYAPSVTLNTDQDKHFDREYDLYVLGGGNLLSPWKNSYSSILSDVIDTGTPLIIFGTGIDDPARISPPSPNTSIDATDIYTVSHETLDAFKHVCYYASAIYVRDFASKQQLHRYGVTRQVFTLCDLALQLTVTRDETIRTKYNIPSDKPTLVFSPTFMNNKTIDENNAMMHTRIIPFLNMVSVQGWNIVVLPMFSYDIEYCECIARAVSAFDNRTTCHAINTIVSPDDALSIMSVANCVVGMKLHSMILATVAHTPFIGINYHHKCKDYCDWLDYPYIVELDYTALYLYERFREVVDKRDDIERRLTYAHYGAKGTIKSTFTNMWVFSNVC
jgi:hypothetical protein